VPRFGARRRNRRFAGRTLILAPVGCANLLIRPDLFAWRSSLRTLRPLVPPGVPQGQCRRPRPDPRPGGAGARPGRADVERATDEGSERRSSRTSSTTSTTSAASARCASRRGRGRRSCSSSSASREPQWAGRTFTQPSSGRALPRRGRSSRASGWARGRHSSARFRRRRRGRLRTRTRTTVLRAEWRLPRERRARR
jgi:hypothetical protein